MPELKAIVIIQLYSTLRNTLNKMLTSIDDATFKNFKSSK